MFQTSCGLFWNCLGFSLYYHQPVLHLQRNIWGATLRRLQCRECCHSSVSPAASLLGAMMCREDTKEAPKNHPLPLCQKPFLHLFPQMKSCSFLPKASMTYLNLFPDHFTGVLSLGLVSSFPVCVLLSHSFPHLCHILLICFLTGCSSSPGSWELLPPEFPMDLPAGFHQICECHSGQSNTGQAHGWHTT